MANRMIPALTLLSFAFLAGPAIGEAQGVGVISDPERFRELTGYDLNGMELVEQHAVVRREGTSIILDERSDGTVTWEIYEDLGKEGVQLSIGAAQDGKIIAPTQTFALAIARSPCGGTNEPILKELEYYPLYHTYCRKHLSSNPRRGKEVYNLVPQNKDPNLVLATYEMLCNDARDIAKMKNLGIWRRVCVLP
jgi:hypothetical protein